MNRALCALTCMLWQLGCGGDLWQPSPDNLPVFSRLPITDGTPTDQYPYVGFIFVGDAPSCQSPLIGSICTGTLIGSRTVVTAAHCLHPGSSHMFCLKSGTYRPVADRGLIPHPEWDATTLANDVGLMILDRAPSEPRVQASAKPVTMGQRVEFVGFGITGSGKADAGAKRTAANIVDKVERTRFWISGTGNGVGNVCMGDSGGPAFVSENGSPVQLGVTSAGMNPCGTRATFTRVDAYIQWILDNSPAGDLYQGEIKDTEKPTVTITSPTPNAVVGPSTPVSITAVDNIGVSAVEVLVDNEKRSSLAAAPYEVTVTLIPGTHVIGVKARDVAGNEGVAEVTVAAGADQPPPGPPPTTVPLGGECKSDASCQSGLCVRLADQKTLCAKTCAPEDPASCPLGTACQADGQGRFACTATASNPEQAALPTMIGGCAVATRGKAPSPWLGFALLLAVSLLVRARRPR